jgi:hypothetical protein
MKRTLSLLAAFAIVAALLAFSPPPAVHADDPVINITAPMGTVFVSSFPYAATLSMNVSHSKLHNLNALKVSVDGVELYATVGNPFDGDDLCRPVAFTGGATCATTDDSNATITIPWSVAAPGTFSVGVEIRHQGDEGVDTETITFTLVAVEYPAPPATANAYINSTYKGISAKKRGCVISQIANNHAQDSKYGPKGGPYDNNLVRSDVDAYIFSCP